jgi:hypothetical protein
MRCGFSTITHEEEEEEEEVSLDGQVVPRKDTFQYLGSMLQKDGDIDEDMNHQNQSQMDELAPSFWHSL